MIDFIVFYNKKTYRLINFTWFCWKQAWRARLWFLDSNFQKERNWTIKSRIVFGQGISTTKSKNYFGYCLPVHHSAWQALPGSELILLVNRLANDPIPPQSPATSQYRPGEAPAAWRAHLQVVHIQPQLCARADEMAKRHCDTVCALCFQVNSIFATLSTLPHAKRHSDTDCALWFQVNSTSTCGVHS